MAPSGALPSAPKVAKTTLPPTIYWFSFPRALVWKKEKNGMGEVGYGGLQHQEGDRGSRRPPLCLALLKAMVWATICGFGGLLATVWV